MNPIRVVVVDDQDLVRAGFVALLNAAADIEVVGEAGQGEEALVVVRQTRPDVVLLDIRMPVLNGIDVIARIRSDPAFATTRIVVLTTFNLDEYVFGALRAGADAFLLKDTPPEELLRSVRVVAEGDALLSPAITRRLLDEFATPPIRKHTPRPGLTERETDVLTLVLQGLSNTQIAERLYIGPATAKTYVSRLLGKFMVETRVALAIAAYEAGFDPRTDSTVRKPADT
jgi:DNA-binding NarL/FixJ family response regulator